MTLIIVLIVIGLAFLVAEVLIIPGIAIAGIAGFVLIVFGVYLGYNEFGATVGHIVLLSTAVASVATVALSLRAKTWRWATLNASIDSKASEEYDQLVKPGDRGVTVSRLSPMGKAVINGNTVEVTAPGQMIDPQSPVEVVKVEANKIIVKLKQ